ncbi:hypothetical protein O181_066685 [Austropuccinia psidii MF-1]|uniref:Uncharacterized protein n=1 Tax=Austropuccinia psidii MF-1 TaxID=1389203 RepID=A0A9Q3EXI5_9BASI|nr:hypothetical protein [Austropuccinia psidii MF-1]
MPSRNHWLFSLSVFLQGNTATAYFLEEFISSFYLLYSLDPSKVPLASTPEVPQLWAQVDRGPHLEGAEPSIQEGRGPRRSRSFSGVFGGFSGLSKTTFKGPGEDGEEEEENYVEVEVSDGTEGVPAPVGTSQSTGGLTIAQCNKPDYHASRPSSLAIMQQITQIMANI